MFAIIRFQSSLVFPPPILAVALAEIQSLQLSNASREDCLIRRKKRRTGGFKSRNEKPRLIKTWNELGRAEPFF